MKNFFFCVVVITNDEKYAGTFNSYFNSAVKELKIPIT